jgi:hypothetical protein
MKTNPKQLFTNEQLYQIAHAAQNVKDTCMFEIGLSALSEGRNIGQSEGALLPHIRQLINVLPINMLLEVISNGGKDDETGN